MALKYDISTMSHEGYTIRTTKAIYQSHGFNFGVPMVINFETMWCKKCNRECPTRRKLIEERHSDEITGVAFEGWCEKCNMSYFVKKVWG